MDTIVLGGSGFLGGAIAEEALREGRKVGILDVSGSQADCDLRFGRGVLEFIPGDILDEDLLLRRFESVEEVYHLAGKLGTSELNATPAAAVKVNILGSINVFEAAIACGVARIFHASKPNVWLNAYSITKHAAERLGAMYDGMGSSKTRLSSLRYFNAYGPRQARGPVRKLIPTFVEQALTGEPLEIYGDGDQVVDLIYIDDLARLTVRYMHTGDNGGKIIAPDCGRGVPVTVNEVAHAINNAVGNRAGVRHLPMRPGETAGTVLVADVGPLKASVPDFRFTDWQTSLERTIDWYATRRSDR